MMGVRLVLCLFPLLMGCANFRHLASDLEPFQKGYLVTGVIENADDFKVPVRVAVFEWNRSDGRIYSGDRLDLAAGGAFAFSVKSPVNQHVAAFADDNRDGKWQAGEALWFHEGPVDLNGERRMVKVRGRLAHGLRLPADLQKASRDALAGRVTEEAIQNRGVRIVAGEVANLDDPRFAATRGPDGLWTPATLAITQGFGVYFLEPYDPLRTPVLFVHGAAGSPQDWRKAMEELDRKRYQAWFYFYPSGGRLEKAAGVLDEVVRLLERRYGFERLDVVAHSMGGLVARRFVIKNRIEGGHRYIRNFVTFSTPWDGHEAAQMGVKWAPTVVPSWYDMEQGSAFLEDLFDHRLQGRVRHHLFYGHRASRSVLLPAENDGTVSVASQTRKEAREDAVGVLGYDEDHISILSARGPLAELMAVLDAGQ